jgi:hypothetical protein
VVVSYSLRRGGGWRECERRLGPDRDPRVPEPRGCALFFSTTMTALAHVLKHLAQGLKKIIYLAHGAGSVLPTWLSTSGDDALASWRDSFPGCLCP